MSVVVESFKQRSQTLTQSVLEMVKDLVKELRKTYASLRALKTKEVSGAISTVYVPEAKAPAKTWKQSITKHTVMCLECGALFKQLSVRHLKEHDLDARSYRIKHGIPRTQPLSAKATTVIRKKIVQQNRPWEKAPTYIKAHKDKGRKPKATRKQTAKESPEGP
ncbi:hypothetical protein NKDENANG_03896 [Candidatus Entotheonellaceae bacterium PAL068K]